MARSETEDSRRRRKFCLPYWKFPTLSHRLSVAQLWIQAVWYSCICLRPQKPTWLQPMFCDLIPQLEPMFWQLGSSWLLQTDDWKPAWYLYNPAASKLLFPILEHFCPHSLSVASSSAVSATKSSIGVICHLVLLTDFVLQQLQARNSLFQFLLEDWSAVASKFQTKDCSL